MKQILSLFLVLFSVTSFAASPGKKTNYLTDKYMKMINLDGLRLEDAFGDALLGGFEKLHKIGSSKDLNAMLVNETKTVPVSSIYEIGAFGFNNMYVFVGKPKSKTQFLEHDYVLNVVLVREDQSMTTEAFEIVKASVGQLDLELANTGEEEVYKATIQQGTFWPY